MKHIALVLALSFAALAQQPVPEWIHLGSRTADGVEYQAYIDSHSIHYVKRDGVVLPDHIACTIRTSPFKDGRGYTIEKQEVDLTSHQIMVYTMTAHDYPGVDGMSYDASKNGWRPFTPESLWGLVYNHLKAYDIAVKSYKPDPAPTPAPAPPPPPTPQHVIWYTGMISAGRVNPGIAPVEYWSELDLTNTGRDAVTLDLTARHHNGKLFQQQTISLKAGEKQTVRIEDTANVIMTADPHKGLENSIGEFTLEGDVLPDTVKLFLRGQELHGDKLQTLSQPIGPARIETSTYYPLLAGEDPSFTLTNTTDQPVTVLFCMGGEKSCTSPDERIEIKPYATEFTHHKAAVAETVRFVKAESVLILAYSDGKSKTSTFSANSGISFGAPIDNKETK
jgi:hypothetical protein